MAIPHGAIVCTPALDTTGENIEFGPPPPYDHAFVMVATLAGVIMCSSGL